jgi:ribonucleoside-diphosphate reductase alpha chain
MRNSYGPKTAAADSLHAMKYRGIGEDFREAMNRVAYGLKDDGKHYHELRQILLLQRFCPGGRIQGAIGSSHATTAYNCLGGETLTLTRDYGLVPLESIVDQTVRVLDGLGQWTWASIRSFGEQLLHEISFTNGRKRLSIRATMEHAWVKDNKRITTRELKRNDRIDFRAVCIEPENAQDYAKGVVHGFIYGDGTQTRDRFGFHVRLCKPKEKAMVSFLANYPNSNPPSYEGDTVYYFYDENAWTNFKTLPNLDYSDSYIQGFLRGWFCADGSVSSKPEVILTINDSERKWLEQFGSIANFHVTSYSYLSSETNYGIRNKVIANVRLDRRFLSKEDFLRQEHKARFVPDLNDKWRVAYISPQPVAAEIVYCAVVNTTNSFTLSSGLHSGNCYVSGTIEDSFVEGSGSIMSRAHEAAATMRMGGGIGYDFSTLRPRGDLIRKLHTQSTGPVSFMNIFNSVCLATSSSGHRRGAQMGILRIDHPDIEEFIRAKQNTTALTGFNLSIGITDAFMEARAAGKPFDLTFGGQVYKTVDAQEFWEKIMRATWDWAEPGVVFIDTINKMNNLWYAENIAATNPCGEQPLPPFGACLLGSFNLVKYLQLCPISQQNGDVYYYFDYDQLIEDIPVVVRGMDNVIDRTLYPLPQQKLEALSKRRMGLGVMGLANAGEACGLLYGSAEFLEFERKVMQTIKERTYWASTELAKEKGSFALYDSERYAKGKFIKSLSPELQDKIRRHGIRNSHLTSVAPTGTISLCADNVSGGIEPVFAYELQRQINTPTGPELATVQDYGVAFLNIRGKLSSSVTAAEHVAVLGVAQAQVDSAVSKTINMDGTMPWNDFKRIYETAWELGCKGCTTFNSDGKRMALLVAKDTEQTPETEITCAIVDPTTGQRDCG